MDEDRLTADGKLIYYSDLKDGSQFATLCEKHPKVDSDGRPCYTFIITAYVDSVNRETATVISLGNLPKRYRNMKELSIPLCTSLDGAHIDVYKDMTVLLQQVLCNPDGDIYYDDAIKTEIRGFLHLYILGADSQFRCTLASTQNPGVGSALAFGHKIPDESTCHAFIV